MSDLTRCPQCEHDLKLMHNEQNYAFLEYVCPICKHRGHDIDRLSLLLYKEAKMECGKDTIHEEREGA